MNDLNITQFFQADDEAVFRRTGTPSLMHLERVIRKAFIAKEDRAKLAIYLSEEILRYETEQDRIVREAEFKKYDEEYLEEFNTTSENPCPICLEHDDTYHTMKTLDCGCNVHMACIATWGELQCPVCQQEIYIELFRGYEFLLKHIDITILHHVSFSPYDGDNLMIDSLEYYYIWIYGEYLALITGFNQKLVGNPRTLRDLRRAARGMQWNLE